MTSAITPILVSTDVERLAAFYQELFAAERTLRVPDDGPVFYQGLRIGESDLGLVADERSDPQASKGFVLSIEVADVDATLARVEALGGRAPSPPNDMPWGQRVAHISDPEGNAVNLTRTS